MEMTAGKPAPGADSSQNTSACGRLDKRLKDLIVIAVVFKLVMFLVVYLASNLLPICEPLYSKDFVYPPHENINAATAFKTWDAMHYLFLSENGYPNDMQMSDAFYPLYPFLIYVFRFAVRNSLVTGLVLSNVASLTAIILLYLLLKKKFGDRTAMISCLLLMAFPTFFYTGLVYTEALLLMLVLWLFYFRESQRYFLAGIAAFLIPLTRPTGILIALPLAAIIVWEMVRRGSLRLAKEYFLMLCWLLGVSCYLVVMKSYTGSYFTGFRAQGMFVAGNSIASIFHPVDWFDRNFIHLDYTINGYTTGVIARIFFILFICSLYHIYRRMGFSYLAFAVALGLIPAMSGSFMSYQRYLLVVFPLFPVWALWLKDKSYILMVPMLCLEILFLVMHSLNYWVA